MPETHNSKTFPGLPGTGPARPARPLKICIASCEFIGPIRNGGIGTAYTTMAQALARAGHQVTLFYTQGAKCENETIAYWEKFYRAQGLNFVARPSDPALRIDAPPHAAAAYETYRWLKKQKFDLVHFPEWGADAYYSLLARHQGIAFAETLFCVGTHSPTAWIKEANSEFYSQSRDLEVDFMERQCVALADIVVSPCQYMLDWMRVHGFQLPANSFVRQNILPASARREAVAAAPPVSPVSELVFFGRLETRKGIELFCDALDRLTGEPALKNLKITFLGKSATVSGRASHIYIHNRAEKWPWALKLVSDLDQPAAMRYLQSAGRLAVIPSLMENSPYTVLECLGSRIPFVASRVGGISELIAPEDLLRATFLPHATDLAELLKQTLRSGKCVWKPAVEADVNEAAWVAWHNSLAERRSPDRQAGAPAIVPENPRVTVGLAHFNRPQMLKQALASLAAQDYKNFEVIIVDDGSTAIEAIEYLKEIEPWLRARNWRLLRQENRYLSAARNTAARHADGEYLMFMDDDNFAKPEEISTFVKVALHTGADIVTCCMDYFEGTGPPAQNPKQTTRWVPLGGTAAAGFFRNVFGDANCLVKKSAFEKLGGFTEIHGVTHEDWEFLAAAALKNFHLEVIPEALFHYRYTPGSMIRSTSKYRNHLRHLRPYLDLTPPALHQILLTAQGAHIASPQHAAQAAYAQSSIKWRSEFEAARILAKMEQKKPAAELLLKALKSAEDSKHSSVILDAMFEVGRELRLHDAARAREILQLAAQLAESLKNGEAARLIKTVLAENIEAPDTGPAGFKKLPVPVGTVPSTPRASIVIPVFNNFALTRACLESLAKTTAVANFEIIVVDNASTDAVPEFLRERERAGEIRLIANADNQGFARACNQGAQIARSPLLVFLNNDTQVASGWLDAMIAAAQQPAVGVVGGKLLYANNTIQHAGIGWINGLPDHPHRHAAADAPAVSQFRELDMVTGACFMIHCDLFLQLAGFDEIYRNGVEDIDLCLRVRAAGRKVVYEPKAVVYHLEGQSAGRFDHVNENIKIFFARWNKSFDAQKNFIMPSPVRIIAASQSCLLKPAAAAAVKIDWEGSFLDNGSLSHVNRELTGALKAFSDFRINQVAGGTLVSRAPELTVRHAWPPNWQRPRQGKLAVIQPWEFGALPQEWIRQARDVDEFWVPTNYVRDCYVQSGVPAEKVFVVPNGVNAEKFNPQVAPMKLATSKKFKFLFVGGTIGRKGPDLLLKAYLQNFTAADDVCLVIKDFGGKSFYTGQTFEAQIRAAQSLPNAPEILYLNEELPPEALPGIYTACDCLVLPYRGEGFGLPVLEAMACALPVIVTAGGATDDFVRDEFAWRIPAGKKFFGHEVSGMKLAAPGWLLEPDLPALGQRMRLAFENPDEVRARGKLASCHAQEFYSWKNAAEMVAERIREIVTNGTAKSAPIVQKNNVSEKLPAVAAVGQLLEARKSFGLKKFPTAWEATLAALAQRPFHPEAFLLLAEIALAAGDSVSARECAQRAQTLAPDFRPAKQFLKKPLKGNAKPDWLKLPEKARNRLSVCLIVKNEEKFLGQCLKSIHGLAAQIVVVDTGSTDRTLAIAKELGAEIHAFTWCDDFAAARNAALEHATGDWVLMLDADEELPPAQHAHLLADMERADRIGCRLPLVNHGQEMDGQSFVPRLFRNVPGIFYAGRVHEQIFPALLPLSKSWGLKLDFGAAQLLHHGYTKEMIRDRNKIARNLELLQRAVAENPHDANLMMNLGLELVRSEDLAAGVEKYRAAFRLMSAQAPELVAPELREVLLTQFTAQLYKIRAHEEVVQILNSPLAKTGGLLASHHFALGLSLFELKQFSAAAEQMRQCIAKRKQPVFSPVNTDIHTVAPEHCLALSLAKIGDAAGAEKEFLAALAEPDRKGNFENVKLDYAKFLAAQNRAVEAFHKLNEVVTANPRHLAAWQTGAEIALSRPEFLEFARDWTSEAMRHVAPDFIVNRQRAEVLLLSGELKASAELWERLWNSEHQPATLAALILCETLASQKTHAPNQTVDEPATSRAFIKWYQRLIAMRAHGVVQQLNGRLNELAPVLPTAAQMLEKALAEPQLSRA